MFIEHKLLYNNEGPVPTDEYLIPFGVADVKRQGKDLTILTYSRMVNVALQAAEQLVSEGNPGGGGRFTDASAFGS